MKHIEQTPLGEFEQLVLLALVRLGNETYGAAIRREIETRTGRDLAISAVYITLDRLQEKGYLESRLGEPVAERGGRPRRYYRVRPAGVRALEKSWSALRLMWEGLEPKVRET